MAVVELGPLGTIGWLAGRPEAFRTWVMSVGHWRNVEKGQVIYEAGDEATGCFGLAEGALDVTLPAVGEEPVTLHRADPGFWAGELALLSGSPRLVSVHASRRSRLLHIPAAAIVRRLQDDPREWPNFYALTYENYTNSLMLLAEALVLPPATRLARRLLTLAAAGERIDISQGELAALIGVTRVTIQRAINQLVCDGAIETGYRAIVVRDLSALERRAAGRIARQPSAPGSRQVASRGAD